MAPKPDLTWQVDRHVNIATIISLLTLMIGQIVGGALWVSAVSSRLDAVEKKVEAQAIVLGPIVERSIRLETRLEAVMGNISEVKDILRRSSILTYIPGQPLPGDESRPIKPALTR